MHCQRGLANKLGQVCQDLTWHSFHPAASTLVLNTCIGHCTRQGWGLERLISDGISLEGFVVSQERQVHTKQEGKRKKAYL